MGRLHGTQAFGLVLAACIGLGIGTDARAHDIYTKWERPDTGGSCCSNKDCRQATARYSAKGWEVLLEGEWVEVPPGRVLDPVLFANPDGMHHVCVSPERHIYCFMPGEAKF